LSVANAKIKSLKNRKTKMNEKYKSVGIVSNRLVDSWLDIISAKSASEVRLAEANKNSIIEFAKELGIHDEVIESANKIWKGEK
jgi:hypothetical protein